MSKNAKQRISRNILDPGFVYTVSAKTDITKTFAKYGYVPPSQKRESNAKAK